MSQREETREPHSLDQSASMPHGRAVTIGIHLALLLAVLSIYGQTARFDFINYDDDIYVYENRFVLEGLSVDGVQWAFTARRAGGWHPITWLSLMLDADIYGDHKHEAGGYHFTNLLFHAFNAMLLFELLRRMTGDLWPSAMVAALLAVHPLHVESVAWVTERKDVLSIFFSLLAILAYIRYTRGPSLYRYLLVLACFALSLGAKSMMVTLPCVLLLFDFWPLRRIVGSRFWSFVRPAVDSDNSSVPQSAPTTILWLILEKIPLFAIAIACRIVGYLGQETLPQDNLFDTSLGFRFMNTVTVYMVYLRKMMWPTDLATLYPVFTRVIHLWHAVAATAFLLATTIAAVWYRLRWPWFFVGWMMFVGVLFPVSSLFQLWYSAHSDRLVYFPAIGIYIAVVFGLAAASTNWPYRRTLLAAAASFALVAFSILAFVQVGYWKNSYTLFTRAIDVSPRNLRAYKHRGWAYQNDGQHALAISDYDVVLQLAPDRTKVYTNRGIAYRHLGNIKRALSDFDRAIELDPDEPKLFISRGQAFEQHGNATLAMRDYNEAIRLNSKQVTARANRGRLHLSAENYPQAIADFSEAIRLNPGYVKAFDGRGKAHLRRHEYRQAIADFGAAIRRDPEFASPYASLGLTYAAMKNYAAAIQSYSKAIELAPQDVETLNNYAWLLATCEDHQYRDAKRAIASARSACELTGYNQTELLDTLAASYAEAGQFNEAASWQTKAVQLAPQAAKAELRSRLERYQKRSSSRP